MSAATVALGVIGGIAAVGIVWWATDEAASATPPAQAGLTINGGAGSIVLANGQAASAVVTSAVHTLMIGLPPNGVWVSLLTPAGSQMAPVNTSNPATVSAANGTFTGVWTVNGTQQSGSITIGGAVA